MNAKDTDMETFVPACGCGENAPSLLDVDGEPVVVFGLSSVLLQIRQQGLTPDTEGFDQVVLRALRVTKNRIPQDQQAGCVTAITEIYREYLEASRIQGEQP